MNCRESEEKKKHRYIPIPTPNAPCIQHKKSGHLVLSVRHCAVTGGAPLPSVGGPSSVYIPAVCVSVALTARLYTRAGDWRKREREERDWRKRAREREVDACALASGLGPAERSAAPVESRESGQAVRSSSS